MEARVHRYLVIVVDTEEVLYHIARTANVHTVSRHIKVKTVSVRTTADLESVEDIVDSIAVEIIADKASEVAVSHFDLVWCYRFGIIVGDRAYCFSPGETAY